MIIMKEASQSQWWTMFGKRFDGEAALWFLLLYSLSYFLIEFFVASNNVPRHLYWGLTGIGWVILLLSVLSLLSLCGKYLMLNDIKIGIRRVQSKFSWGLVYLIERLTKK